MRNIVLKNTAIVVVSLLLSACINYQREIGAENIWRTHTSFVRGSTTQADVLTTLGPPSQVIDMNSRSIFYYLQEQVVGTGFVLLIYNDTTEKTVYDRAMFVFDQQGVLEDFAYSHEQIP
jgi:outer membrane protein assembly factor BamE (lipoprotein component of BamABCDE complex)